MGYYNSTHYGSQIDEAVQKILDGEFQEKLTPGDGIKIEGNTISAEVDHSQFATKEYVDAHVNTIDNKINDFKNAGYLYAGVAIIDTDPGTPDAKVFYIANGKGTYENFGGINVTEDDVVILYYDTAWHKVATGVASNDKLTEFANKGEVRHIERDLGMYPELEPVPLNSEVTGKYINSDGKYVDASDWNIASIGTVSLGNTYLLNMVSSANMVLGVALFVSRVYKRDKEGKIIGTTLTPLFSAKNTSIPASGYVLFEAMDDYDEVLICYKPALTTQMLVARWGFKASHATQLRNLRLVVDNKTDFEGIYELLTAGYALNLVGKGNGEPQAFMSRKTGGGNITDGSAVIKEVDGVQPIVWNQMIKSPSQSPLNYLGSNISISGNTVTFRAEATGRGAFFYPLVIVGGHKYFCSVHIKTTSLTNRVRLISSQFTGEFVYCNETTEWQKIESLGTAPANVKNAQLTVADQRESNWDDVQMKNLMVIDLTQMFGAGNEPSTYEEYLDRISHYHIEDTYAYNAGEVVNYKGVGIKTTNIDGTKSYIRDWSEVMKKYFPDGMTSLNGVKDFFNDKKAVRKWGCKVFDGTEVWYRILYGGMSRFSIEIADGKRLEGNMGICSHYPTDINVSDNEDKAVDKTFKLYVGYQALFIDNKYQSVDAWKSHLAELYAAGTPLVVYYELAEPVEDIFEKPLNLTYTVINGGTETSLATENSTQFEGSIFYGKDYVGVIDELQLQNRVTQIEFENWEN